ncbi:endo-1,4-beta-xylanase [Stigmatella aurantiaca]|uniref:Beta-xylanase n=1 Tax=Stigmatella aurantiaca TaxID=41 RepID=A0A1H7YGY4_STIAU|nr:endo-1,4-beta-xylanase [Stigmatella aurantiaca]SEM45526.1 endo-1,4-beta-xylanase [Stigmatella aurantiaca]
MRRGWFGSLVSLALVGCGSGSSSDPGASLDSTAPFVSIQAPTFSARVSGTLGVVGTASDDVAVASVEVQVDADAFVPATGTTAWSYLWDTSPLSDGVHALTVRVTDTSGNVGLTTVPVEVSNFDAGRPMSPVGMALTVAPKGGVLGDMLRASATFTNPGPQPLTLPRLRLTALAPAGATAGVDFAPTLGPITLAPGQTVTLEALGRPLPTAPAGEWQVLPSYEDAQGFTHFGPSQRVPLLRQVRLGAATHQKRLFDAAEPAYAQTFLTHFDSLTPEYEMKIAQLQPAQGQFDFAIADQIVAFAEANGKQVRGHTLIWGNSLPAWLTGRTWTREELIQVLETHIATVVGRYRGRIPEWDVVNEAFLDDGSWRPNLWLTTIGTEYIALAFQAAHRADPSAKLFYNDYNVERINAKSTAVYNLARSLQEQGVPIHGIGMQSHVTPNYYPTQAQLEAVLSRLEQAGLEGQLTELDVSLAKLTDTPDAEKFELQAQIYQGLVAACQARPGCTRITTWGITDKYTYLGSTGVPLLFDTQYAPKRAMEVTRHILGR